MDLSEIYRQDIHKVIGFTPKISFEILPPLGNDISLLYEKLRFLRLYNPVLISLAHSSNNGVNRFSVEDMKSIRDLEFNLMPQFSCVSSIYSEMEKQITAIENLGIENVLINMGKIPDYIKTQELDFDSCSKLITYVKEKSTLSVGITYNIDNVNEKFFKVLKRDIDFGADAIFTYPFENNEQFYHFIHRASNLGINKPIIAGIYVNDDLKSCAERCMDLIEFGVCGLHFYLTNNYESVSRVLENIL